MRILLVSLVLAGCTDAADVPTTVVHVDISSSCATADCYQARIFDYDCGPQGDTEVTSATTSVDVITDYKAKDIAGYIQLQYSDESQGKDHYHDRVLRERETEDVYAAYGGDPLYTLTATGQAIDIATDKLMTMDGTTLTFAYDVPDVTTGGVSVVEVHAIDAPKAVRVEADSPGIMDSCCSASRAQDGALVMLALLGGLGVGRRRRR